MRKIVFTVALVIALAASEAASGADCNYEQNEIDLFTQERLVTTRWDQMTSLVDEFFNDVFATTSTISVATAQKGAREYLAIQLQIDTKSVHEPSVRALQYEFVVPKGSPLSITLADGSTARLFTEQEYLGKTRSILEDRSYLLKTTATIFYTLNATTADALTSQGASDVSVSTARGTHQFEIGSKSFDDIRQAIQCMQQAEPA